MGRRLRVGDVCELAHELGYAYIQYLGKDGSLGDCVLVRPKLSGERLPIDENLFAQGYACYYAASAASRQGLIAIVGNVFAPKMPGVWRRPGAMTGTTIETWVIRDEAGQQQVIGVPTETEAEIPIAMACSHVSLLERIEAGWEPRMARSDLTTGLAPAKPDASASLKGGSRVTHYMYFEHESSVLECIDRLVSMKLDTHYARSASGPLWLLKVIEVGSGDALVLDFLETIARELGGEYDGHEVG